MILADYTCPHHGTFETLVESPAPDEVVCTELVPPRGASVEYTSTLVSPDVCGQNPCGLSAHWTPSPVLGRVRLGEVVRGPNERPPNRMSLDTRKLGEGQPIEEYRAERAAIGHEMRRAEIKDFKEGR